MDTEDEHILDFNIINNMAMNIHNEFNKISTKHIYDHESYILNR